MTRLIDADDFLKWLDVGHLRNPGEVCFCEADVAHMIKSRATIDPVTAAAEALGMSPDRLRELAQAEKEGRLVVLSEPMKPMVYKPNDTDVYCPSCGESLSGGWPLSDADDLRKLCQCLNCGQSIDDTRCEAAEAALKEGELKWS